NHDLYHYLDRMDVQGLADTTFLSNLKPYGRQRVSHFLSQVDTSSMSRSQRSWHRRMRVLADDSLAMETKQKGILRYFYQNRRDLVAIQEGPLRLFINPVLHTSGGVDLNNDPRAAADALPIYLNARGAVIRGSLWNKLGFHTEVFNNVTRVPHYTYQEFLDRELVYGQGFVKRFGEQNGLDYLGSRAYLTYQPWQGLRIKFGKDRAFWGNGYQSLLLSDFAADYLLMTITARIWKLEYVSHFGQMIDFIQDKNDTEGTFPRKYGAFHQLSYQPNDRFSIGFFESVIYAPTLPNGVRGVEWQYFNPLILYRTAEQYVGSPDNSILGLHWKYNFFQRFQWYGQFLLDDYNFGKRNEGSNYWGNKFGWQSGLKYMDVLGISNLDLQVEYNRLRPFTYQHFSSASNYSHYGQHLGHAAGANLQDVHLILRYRPFPAWQVMASYSYLVKGLDEEGINYGGDIRVPFVNRPGDFDQVVGQGVRQEVQQFYGRLSYQIGQLDAYLEGEARYRTDNDLRSASFLIGLRTQIQPRPIKY
ncbi:MAG: capsule assembly Wzi family protein, partial [Bacteroidota bacterium]